MLAFNFTLLAVFSYIAMIGANPIGNEAAAGAIGRRQESRDYCTYYPEQCKICDAEPGTDYCEELCASVPSELDPPSFCDSDD